MHRAFHRSVVVLATATATVLALTSCGVASAPTPSSTPAAGLASGSPAVPGDGVLRIGSLLPITGLLSFLGPSELAGVKAAVSDINASGGVLGKPVVLVQADSGDASSTIAEKSLTTLLDSKVDVIIGPASSALASRLIPKTIADHVAMISPAATLPQLSGSQDDGFFFRTVPAYPLQALALAKAMAAAGSPRIALVYSDDAPGQSLAAALPPAVKDQSGAVIASLGVAPDAKKFDTVLAALADAKPDAVVLATQGGATTLSKALITALTAAHLGGPKLWLTTQNLADYSRALPGGRLKGAHGVLDGRTPSATFIAELAKQNPRLTRYDYAAEAYDATVIAALAAALAKSDSGDAIKAELPTVTTQGILCTGFSECVDVLKTDSDIHYDGVSGPLNFDANGDIKSAYYGGYIYDARNRSSRVSTVLVP